MSLQNVAPIKDWARLPGGGEVGLGTLTGQIGILSGSVTTATAPEVTTTTVSRATTTASPNLLAAAAATSTNPIVLENQKQGNPQSEWDIDGAGSSNIEGFATDISVNNGNRIDFKINTNSSNYRIDIYRMGYYGGMGARKVATIQHTGVQNQPAPLRDATTGLVDAGNWSVSASWDVPADAVSGVYIAKLVRQDGTSGANHIPFIVRDDSSTSDIVFQTSDTTWQAYNGWGGANFYGGNGPATGQGAGRAYAVSYNRPIATRGGIGTSLPVRRTICSELNTQRSTGWSRTVMTSPTWRESIQTVTAVCSLTTTSISTLVTTNTGQGSNAPMSRRPAMPA